MPIKTPTTQGAKIKFYDGNGNLFDPDTITCTVTNPSGTATVYTFGTSYELSRISTGYYLLAWPGSTGEVWVVKWFASLDDGSGGTYQITDEQTVSLLDTFT